MFRMFTVPMTTFAAALIGIVPAAPAHAGPDNPVLQWNAFADAVFTPSQGTNPMAQSRTLAILHAAMHDAVNAVSPRFEPYTGGMAAAPGASLDAAVAAAARDVLMTLVPDQAPRVDTEYHRAISALPPGKSIADGIAVGRTAAARTLARRAHDRADRAALPAYVPGAAPGDYQLTPPFDFAAQPGWGQVEPFIINLAAHAANTPLVLASDAYARDLEEVKTIGRRESVVRTPEQSTIAAFWYEDSPLGWNRIANAAARQRGLDPWAAARLLALVNFAMADGFIAGFEAKYRIRFWRPLTAIRAAAEDGNPHTAPEAGWEPLMPTPPVPDYPSTHTVLGWAAAQVLIDVLGDAESFTATSLTLPGHVRRFVRFSDAAEENGRSRIYAGIHFRHAVNHGRDQGRSIGRAVAATLKPRAPQLTAR